MPLSKTNELNLIMNENAKLTVEHSGGDGWTLLHGDTLSIVRAFKAGVFDAVITTRPMRAEAASPVRRTARPCKNTAVCGQKSVAGF